MGQGRNRPLDKEHMSPFLWLLSELAPDASVRSVGSLIYVVPSFLCTLGFFSQVRGERLGRSNGGQETL